MQTDKTIYLVRHGQSADNVAPVFQSPDSPLSEVGHAQAELIAKRVSTLPFELLIASPLVRTKETAAAIQKLTDTPVEFSDLFVERKKPSSINGKPYTDEQANITWRDWERSMHTQGCALRMAKTLMILQYELMRHSIILKIGPNHQ
jgi:broad specificity phosphatase PhoE